MPKMPDRHFFNQLKKELFFWTNKIEAVKVSSQFDHVKKLSDFVGFVARILFLSILIKFVSFLIDNSVWIIFIPLFLFLSTLIVFQLYFISAFGVLISKIIFKTFPSFFIVNKEKFPKIERDLIFYFAMLIVLSSQISLNIAVGDMADKYLEKSGSHPPMTDDLKR